LEDPSCVIRSTLVAVQAKRDITGLRFRSRRSHAHMRGKIGQEAGNDLELHGEYGY
jgi:hypothetical protein